MFASRRCAGAAGPVVQRSRAHTLSSSSSSSRLCRPNVRTAAAASPAELQSLLAQKERELASMFESGRPMPAAAVVAALRSEIASLDAQLNGRPAPAAYSAPGGGGYNTSGGYGSGAGAPRSFGGGPPPMQPPRSSGPPAGAVRSRTEQLADKAYEMVEQQMRSNQDMGQEDDVEIARLEHENTQLRAEAYALLARQQQLEAMLAEVQGTKEPELLLESAESLLARMKAKLQKAH